MSQSSKTSSPVSNNITNTDPDITQLQERVTELEQQVRSYEATISDLKVNIDRYERLVTNVPGMVYQFVLRPNGEVAFPYVSDGSRDIYGLEPEVIQQDAGVVIGMLHPDDRAGFEQSVATSAATLTAWSWEGRSVSAAGGYKWVQAASRPVRQANGDILWDGLLMDITARKQAELALAEQTGDLRKQAELLDLARDAIMVRGLDGAISFWNAGAELLYGWSRDEACSSTSHNLLKTEFPAALKIIELELLETGYWNGELIHQTRDQRTITVASRWVLQRDEAGTPSGVLEINTDITAFKHAAQAQQRIQEELIQMQAVALLELSTPLIPISDTVMVMPLIGSLDSRRAQQILDTLLHGVAQHRTKVAILDITGVPVVDTQVANVLLGAARSVQLLGARVVLTGIRPEVAQTLIGLGVELRGVITRSTLQSGIAYAMGNA